MTNSNYAIRRARHALFAQFIRATFLAVLLVCSEDYCLCHILLYMGEWKEVGFPSIVSLSRWKHMGQLEESEEN